MKRRTLLLLCCCLFLLFPFSASAHPGRTDANGGHYDSSTGEYHYHHGYPAHQHTNGVCPYDFDNKTGQNSGSSSSSSKSTGNSSSVSSVSATSLKYSDADLRIASSEGYEEGYSDGYDKGTAASEERYADGKTDGYNAGFSDGRAESSGEINVLQGFIAFTVIAAAVIVIILLHRIHVLNFKNDTLDSHVREYRKQVDDSSVKLKETAQQYYELKSDLDAAEQKNAELIKENTENRLQAMAALDKVQRCDQFISTFGYNAEKFFRQQDVDAKLCRMASDYLMLVYDASADYLETKERPAKVEAYRIRQLKNQTKQWVERATIAEYKLQQQENEKLTKPVQTTIYDWLDEEK